MKKMLIVSFMALATVTNANAIVHLNENMQSEGGWIDRIGGSAGESMDDLQPVFHAAMNNLANGIEDHALELERQGQIMADWNKLLFGPNGDGTAGLFYDFYYGDAAASGAAFGKLSDKISDVNKELSAGIANVAALSAVAVSDVKCGEVSFGGGYGYHNSQSAVAFGAAVGLTDNWSMNAGIGFNDYDVTVRAGTNVKFKLF